MRNFIVRFVSLSVSLGLSLSACAFEIDKSAMSEAYWKIWNEAEQARIDAEIEANRKADGVFTLADVPAGTEVKAEQISHTFVFGAHLFNFNQLGSDGRNTRHQAMFGAGGIFNSATIAFYWRPFEPVEGQMRFAAAYEDTAAYWNGKEDAWSDWRWRRPASDPCVEFCEKKGIRRHGHILGWGSDHWQTPLWYYAKGEAELPFMKGFLKEVVFTSGRAKGKRYVADDAKRKAFEAMSVKELEEKAPNFVKALNEIWARRFATIGAHYGNRLQSWDVCNESATDFGMGRLIPGDKICKSHYGPMPGDYAFYSFKCAEKAFPRDVNLNINDYQYGFNNAYGRQVADMLARGAKIDIVGSQMHLFDPKQTLAIAEGKPIQTPGQVREVMARLGAMNRPIHLSEITVTSPGDDARGRMIQAVALRNLYRLWFSIKPMMGITMWNTVDECGAPGEPKNSGLMTRDVRPKPAYEALDQLINHEWHTTATVKAGEGGAVAFRGFRGKYRLTWKGADGKDVTRIVTLK